MHVSRRCFHRGVVDACMHRGGASGRWMWRTSGYDQNRVDCDFCGNRPSGRGRACIGEMDVVRLTPPKHCSAHASKLACIGQRASAVTLAV